MLKKQASSVGKMSIKSAALNYHKTLKDLKGLLFLFKNKDNKINLNGLTSIFFHLGTFNYTYKERYNLLNAS